MTYNVFSGTLNPTQFKCNASIARAVIKQCVVIDDDDDMTPRSLNALTLVARA